MTSLILVLQDFVILTCFKATKPVESSQVYRVTTKRQFLSPIFQEFLLFIWSSLKGWKSELTLEPPNGFRPKTLYWESSVLTTRSLLHLQYVISFSQFIYFKNSLIDLLHTMPLKCPYFLIKSRLFYSKHPICSFKSFETTQFSQNVIFICCNICFSSYG